LIFSFLSAAAAFFVTFLSCSKKVRNQINDEKPKGLGVKTPRREGLS